MKEHTVLQIRLPMNIKQQADSVLLELGITHTEAVRTLYQHICDKQEFPLQLKTRTSFELQDTLEEATTEEDETNDQNVFHSLEDFLKQK